MNKNILAIIIVLVIIFAGLLAWHLWPEKEVVDVDEIDEIEEERYLDFENWKSYRNEEYGFEFQYPDHYFIVKEEENSVIIRQDTSKDVLSGASGDIFFSVLNNISDLSLIEWFAHNSTEAYFGTKEYEESQKKYYNSKRSNSQNINIGELEALTFDLLGGYPSDYTVTLISYPEKSIIIEAEYILGTKEENKISERIISTFIIQEKESQEHADSKKDLSECERKQDQYEKDLCYREFATIRKDISICDKINDEWGKESCYSSVAQEKLDISICEKIKDSILRKKCYLDLAGLKKDLSVCDNFSAQEAKEQCYLEVAKAKKDLSICEKIYNTSIKENCYSEVAIASQNLSVCEKIRHQEKRNYCYLYIAEQKQELFICDKITQQGMKDYCYGDIAIAKKDHSICRQIENQWLRDNCHTNIDLE